jgi:hypothetical protein
MAFSQNLVEDLAGLYSSIVTQDFEILNEQSEFYNEDFAYIFEDVCATICISRLSEGYSASAVLDYLDYASENDLIEYYINSDITTLSEEFISEEYFSEQLELLGEALPAVLAGAKLAGKVLAGTGARKAIGSGLAAAGRGLSVAAKRAAGPGVRKAIGGAIGKLKGLAGGAKAVLSKLPKPIKTLGKLAIGGAAFEAGAGAVRKMTGGNKPTSTAKPNAALGPQKALGGQASFKAGGGQAAVAKGKSATDVQRAGSEALFKAGGGAAAIAKKGQTRAQVMAQGSKNVAPKPTAAPKPATTPSAPSGGSGGGSGGGGGRLAPRGSGGPSTPPKSATPAAPKPTDGAERRTPTSDELRAAQSARKAAQEAGKSKEESEKAAVKAGIDRATKPMGGPAGPGQIDTKSVEKDLENFKKKTMNKENYAIIADYFLYTGHADSISEAYYIVAQLDEETLIGTLDEAMTKYERNRQRAAQRAAERNAARDRGQTGNVPGVGYVSPRRERETYRDEAGQERHTSGAKMPKTKKED